MRGSARVPEPGEITARMQRAERSLALWRNPLALLAAALVLAVYTVAILVIPEGAFWSPDEGAKFIQLESLGWRGGFAYEIPYAAKELDPGFELYPARCAPVPLYPVPLGADGAHFRWPMERHRSAARRIELEAGI